MKSTAVAFAVFAAVCAAVFFGSAARASSNFPSEMQDHLDADAVPACTVCHANNAGGFGTVTQPFGQALMGEGLVAADADSLRAALDAVSAAGVDSDGDGEGDVDEVRGGSDPNAAADDDGGDDDVLRYGFGCGAGGAPVVVALAALLRRRRR